MYEGCMNEASLLVRLEHENVIQLLGYCIHETKVFLVYDFAVNATLGDLIYDPACNLLDWNKRCKIILGVARVLVYLHNHAPIRIIHGVVNPCNILLDERFDPKLAGFFASVAVNETDSIYVDNICGAMEYLAPEFFRTLKMSTKVDVFCFGMLVLETVTGKRRLDFLHIWNKIFDDNWLEGTFLDMIDPRIDVDAKLMRKYFEIGWLCVRKDPTNRPTIVEVVDMLLDTLPPTISILEMQARMNVVPDWYINGDEDYDTGAVEAFISELYPR